jgi:hypothetical protein
VLSELDSFRALFASMTQTVSVTATSRFASSHLIGAWHDAVNYETIVLSVCMYLQLNDVKADVSQLKASDLGARVSLTNDDPAAALIGTLSAMSLSSLAAPADAVAGKLVAASAPAVKGVPVKGVPVTPPRPMVSSAPGAGSPTQASKPIECKVQKRLIAHLKAGGGNRVFDSATGCKTHNHKCCNMYMSAVMDYSIETIQKRGWVEDDLCKNCW